ncbi:MAG: hypothetical protein JWO10_530, partial [Microbacteriaceae bacterium]|nr:hypothetical protein [Microbacteriaceae bacterium]
VQEAIDADAATQDLGNRSALPPVGNGDVSYEEAVEAAERHQ